MVVDWQFVVVALIVACAVGEILRRMLRFLQQVSGSTEVGPCAACPSACRQRTERLVQLRLDERSSSANASQTTNHGFPSESHLSGFKQ